MMQYEGTRTVRKVGFGTLPVAAPHDAHLVAVGDHHAGRRGQTHAGLPPHACGARVPIQHPHLSAIQSHSSNSYWYYDGVGGVCQDFTYVT